MSGSSDNNYNDRTERNFFHMDNNSSRSSFNFNEQELRDSHHTQYLTDHLEENTKVSTNYRSPMSNGDTTYLETGGKTAGLETMNALDNVEMGNAALAYVVGRHELKPNNSQVVLRLRESQVRTQGSSSPSKSSNSHRYSYYQAKTPSTSNFSEQGNRRNPHSSTSDATISTNVLFDSPESQAINEKEELVPSGSGTANPDILEGKGNMFVGYYKNYNATEPLPPQNESISGTNQEGMSLKSTPSNMNPLSAKIQKATHQRKSRKGPLLNTKHMSMFPQGPVQDSQEVFISRERLESVVHLSLNMMSVRFMLLCLLVPLMGPVLVVWLDNATFLKLSICKEKTLQELEVLEENPYASMKNNFHNGYSTREIGYFGIIALWIEHEIKSTQDVPAKKETQEDVAREKKVGFKDTTSVINYPVEITDPVSVDMDYTRLKYYLNNKKFNEENIQSEFLKICLGEWWSYLYLVKLMLCLYFGLWVILSILCIILVLVLAR